MSTKGKIILWVILFFVVILPVLGIATRGCRLASKMADNAIETAYEEFKPEELLRKYEWFKDASAALDAKIADIKVVEVKIVDLEEMYEGEKRIDWAREDREQHSIWKSELDGVKLSYNSLASEYNAQMAKFNYRFTNQGMLPEGATEPLPREYKPYKTN